MLLGFLLALSSFAKNQLPEYWSSGLAEINRYELQQARYGSMHPGEVILLFVTEPFDTKQQVKSDAGYGTKNSTPILKLNAFKRFETGIYDYSLMTSVFTDTEQAENSTLKITMSLQDWCGQSFVQWNKWEDTWAVSVRSYFQSVGDQDLELPLAVHEDGIWNQIRLDPDSLPLGELPMIPATTYLSLKHKPTAAYEVMASLSEAKKGFRNYKLFYPALNRTLSIQFRAEAPYEIISWEESYPDAGNVLLTTTAKRSHSTRSYYWEQNQPKDLHLRKKLGL